MKKKFRSIKYRFLLIFVGFSSLILLLLWIFQIYFLNTFYEKYTVRNLKNVATKILKSNLKDIEQLSVNNDFCIQVVDKWYQINNYNYKRPGCIFSKSNFSITKYQITFINSNEKEKEYRFINPDNDVKSILYALSSEDKYIFIYTELEDINRTTNMLKDQLIYVVLIAIALSIIVSYFISNYLSKPIVKITEESKKLGNADYNFIKSNISEIDVLSQTLLIANNELRKTDQLRRDLLANVSHDLKTPLTMIKAYAEMVKDISLNDKKKAKDHLNVIIKETDRLNILVNDILDLSKLESATQKLNITEFDLVKEVKSIIKKYDLIKETENYNIEFNGIKTAKIKADKNKLNQVIYNLLNNAINYTGEDKRVIVNIINDKDNFKVEVQDTGKGVNSKDKEFIFDRYYKEEKNHTRNIVGTGLGLNIVKQILEMHNYEYGFISKENMLTTFYFYIKK